jgi:hypothetical protein
MFDPVPCCALVYLLILVYYHQSFTWNTLDNGHIGMKFEEGDENMEKQEDGRKLMI